MQASDVDVQPYGSFVTFSDPDGNTRALQQLLLDRRTFRQPRHGPASTAGQHAATADTSEPEGTTRPADADIYLNGDRCMNIQSGRPSNRPYGTERPVNAPNNRAPTRRYVCSGSRAKWGLHGTPERTFCSARGRCGMPCAWLWRCTMMVRRGGRRAASPQQQRQMLAGNPASGLRMPSSPLPRLCKPGQSGYSWPEEAARSMCAGWAEPASAGGQLILPVKRWRGRSRCRRRVRVCRCSDSRPSRVCR
jgi:hypothetical protein